MSIATEIQRILTAKADLKTSIESKEVTIEENATIGTYASKVDDVYNKGYEKGKAEGSGDSYYDTFWDSYLPSEDINGDYIFAGRSWNDNTFDPNKNIKPKAASHMFLYSKITGDLDDHVDVDFSMCENMAYAFAYSSFSAVGVIDASKMKNSASITNVFQNATNLTTVKKYITKPGLGMHSVFNGCTALENLTVEGELSGGNINLQYSPLNVASMINVITNLVNYTGTSKEFSYTVKFSNDCLSKLDSEGATSPNGNTWKEYITDLGWLY